MVFISDKTPGTLKLHPADNVAVLLAETSRHGKTVPPGHKIALRHISNGEEIIKYGWPIGKATSPIREGEWVHTHNMATGLEEHRELAQPPASDLPQPLWHAPPIPGEFMGYPRSRGCAGIRNEIWIVNTVGCGHRIAAEIARRGKEVCLGYGLQGPYNLSHPYGCSQTGADLKRTRSLLASLVHHPNAGGVLVLGLGCENNHIDFFREAVGEHDPHRVEWLNAQDVEDEVEAGLQCIERLARRAGEDKKEPMPLSELVVGLKCGGSDAFSGITANPLVGYFADGLVGAGGSVILTEVPEMFGAEAPLLARAKNQQVFERARSVIEEYKDYLRGYGEAVYENPSPGNREGGITTLEEKSLGCILKGGQSPIVDVLHYGERVRQRGVTILEGPGNDLVSVTALAAAGAQLVLFTTGRGTPYGGPVPVIKIASNTPLQNKKPHWIDFNAGGLLHGEHMDEVATSLYEKVIQTASGEVLTRSEQDDLREIAIFKDGATL